MCDLCSGYSKFKSCPCCDEVGVEFVDEDKPKANPAIYDVLSARGQTFVAFTMTPLFLMLWAANVGYECKIDDDGEVQLKDSRGQVDYLCWPQHEDTLGDYPRDAAVEMARWM